MKMIVIFFIFILGTRKFQQNRPKKWPVSGLVFGFFLPKEETKSYTNLYTSTRIGISCVPNWVSSSSIANLVSNLR